MAANPGRLTKKRATCRIRPGECIFWVVMELQNFAEHRKLGGEKRMTVREFKTELWLPLPPAELFLFFGAAANLDAITPPWLNYENDRYEPIPFT
jgi:hypothetical protein